MKKFKMALLNAEKMTELKGGVSCDKTGDTILCLPIVGPDVKLCISFEATCPSGFSSNCSILSSITITCPGAFNIGKKDTIDSF